MAVKPIITTKNLIVTYLAGKSNEVKALVDTSLEIYPGEFVIFFGPSGCGKSTLLYAIAGLDRNAVGSIKVFDKEITDAKDKVLEHHHQKTVGMIFQAFYLINSLPVIQNVMLPQIAINIPLKERKKKAMDLLKYFGVDSQADKLPTELSGGQQQRVAICRALVNDPDIILADEPVGNLDSKSAQDTLALIQKLNLVDKKTIILVTHDPSHLGIANRVFYMKDGRITDAKVNENPKVIDPSILPKEKRKELNLLETGEAGREKEKGKSGIELFAKTYAKQGVVSGLLLEYKAKQIVLEALTDLSAEELERIEGKVKNLIVNGIEDHDGLLSLLDRDEDSGGLGMDKRTSVQLTRKIKDVVKEMQFIAYPVQNKIKNIDKLTEQIRFYLLDTLDIKISKSQSVDVINRVIKERIYGYTDTKGVRAILDSALSVGGAALDRRDSRRLAKLLELILLGRYSKKDHPKVREIKIKVKEIKSVKKEQKE
ncbi:MAG: ABC transporter ATP-binding protein [bacterium]|nr:ABC transporter ATP-binding protein [bacterium]